MVEFLSGPTGQIVTVSLKLALGAVVMLSALAVAAVLALSVFCGAVERTIDSWLPSPIPVEQMAGEIANDTFVPGRSDSSETPVKEESLDFPPAGSSSSSAEVLPTSTYSPHTNSTNSGSVNLGMKSSDPETKNTSGLGRISKSYAVPVAGLSVTPENMPQNWTKNHFPNGAKIQD